MAVWKCSSGILIREIERLRQGLHINYYYYKSNVLIALSNIVNIIITVYYMY